MKPTTKSTSETVSASLPFVPVCEPSLTGNETRYAQEAVASGWISSQGEFLKRFEKGFADFVGRRYAVATCNGTTALHVALKALGVGPGDEVIIPDFTMIACAFAVCYCGARPVFVDADPDTWTMDVRQIESKITARTKAIMAVHIYGHPSDMDPLRDLAKRRGIAVLEDAAEAHGAEYKQRRCGALSDIAAFSFYANKIVTTGEGGMVLTDDESLYRQCLRFKNLCFPLDGNRNYSHDDIGFNYRMTNVQAAIGVAQLERIDALVAARRRTAERYLERLKGYAKVQLPAEKPWAKNVYWMFGLLVEKDALTTRDGLMAALRERGIDSRPFFQPMHRQPALLKAGLGDDGAYAVSEDLAARGLYLPSTSDLPESTVDRICSALFDILGR